MRFNNKIVVSAAREGSDLNERVTLATQHEAQDILDPVFVSTASIASQLEAVSRRWDTRIAEIIILVRT